MVEIRFAALALTTGIMLLVAAVQSISPIQQAVAIYESPPAGPVNATANATGPGGPPAGPAEAPLGQPPAAEP